MRNRILGMHLDGATPTKISDTLGITRRTVYLWLKRYEEQGNVKARERPGRAQLTTAEEDRQILAMFHDNPFLKCTQIVGRLGLSVSPTTVRRRLKKTGLKNHVAARKDFLTDTHKQRRVDFANQYLDEGLDFWSRVIFSDEKTFSSSNHGRVRCWRMPNTR